MLELYQKESCPFCAKVRQAMEKLDLDYFCHTSIKGSFKHEILKKISGQERVPFLVDTTDPMNPVLMCESDDIVAYLYKIYEEKK